MHLSQLRPWARHAWMAALVVGLVASACLLPARANAAAGSATVTTKRYDLGIRDFAQPLPGQFAQMPIRLWGSVSVPAGDGPFPVVVIAHGLHGDNCPEADFDGSSWPCWQEEQRNDLGLGYLGRALAERGMIAVVPDLNGAYTSGWGESDDGEELRFGQVVDATLDALDEAGQGTSTFDGLDLTGQVDRDRMGLLGHSRGGFNGPRWASTHPEVRSLFLLAPFYERIPLPNVPTTVALGSCDGDTLKTGAAYVDRARKDPDRTAKLVKITIAGANHNNYNRTLVKLGSDDTTSGKPTCKRTARPKPRAQQDLLVKMATDHFAATLLEPRHIAAYLRGGKPNKVLIAGIPARVRRYWPGSSS